VKSVTSNVVNVMKLLTIVSNTVLLTDLILDYHYVTSVHQHTSIITPLLNVKLVSLNIISVILVTLIPVILV
jgi:hypothetical protein